jgi:hypothetical protein
LCGRKKIKEIINKYTVSDREGKLEGGREVHQGGAVVANRGIGEGLTEKLTSEQRPAGGDEVDPVDVWRRGIDGQREQQVQRPWGGSVPSVFGEQGGGRYG